MAEIGVPAGLAGLYEPNAPELSAAKLDRPFLVGAYALDRVAGRGRIEEMANEANVIKTLLALRKMQADRQKDVTHYATQGSLTERYNNLLPLLRAAFPEHDIPNPVRGWPEARMAQMTKPSGGINLGDDTDSIVRPEYYDTKTGAILPNATQDQIAKGEVGVQQRTIRSKRKVTDNKGVPTPPAAAAPKTSSAKPKPGEVRINPQTGKREVWVE